MLLENFIITVFCLEDDTLKNRRRSRPKRSACLTAHLSIREKYGITVFYLSNQMG